MIQIQTTSDTSNSDPRNQLVSIPSGDVEPDFGVGDTPLLSMYASVFIPALLSNTILPG